MAVNQASIFLYPPRWQRHVELDATALRFDEQPMEVVSAVPTSGVPEPAVTVESARAWLVDQGFTLANWGDGTILERGSVRSMFGAEKQIQISLDDRDGEVAELYCRFTLPTHSPPPLADWSALVSEMSVRFGLRLAGQSTPCDRDAFLSELRRDQNFVGFSSCPAQKASD